VKFEDTLFPDVKIITLAPRLDERGFFTRFFCSREMQSNGLESTFVQCNHSYSKEKGTLRGLHFQTAPHQEVKIVRCIKGAIYDVVVDIRKDSPTFGQYLGVELNQENWRMLYVPKGFAHGFLTLTPHTEITYLVSEYYQQSAEKGLLWNDEDVGIRWPFSPEVMSEKDQNNFRLRALFP
jgi:dTDP-4-dehydrorhamnose 3,5-epimerase